MFKLKKPIDIHKVEMKKNLNTHLKLCQKLVLHVSHGKKFDKNLKT
jgi:hypothetical protein